MSETLKNQVKKPWQKTWWGYAIQFFLFPLTVTYYVLKSKLPTVAKVLILGVFWVFVIAFGNATDSTSQTATQPTQNNQPAQQEAQTTPTVSDEEVKKKHQEMVMQFEQELYAIEKPASTSLKSFAEASANFSTNDVTTFDLYEMAKRSKDYTKQAQLAYGRLSPNKELPKEVKDHLNKAANLMSTAYFTKGEAMDLAMSYFEDNKLSALSEYKDKMALADRFVVDGVMELMKAKEAVGIPYSEESPTNSQ